MVQVQYDGRFTTLGGGIPLLADDVVFGGLGISGGSIAQEIEIAEGAVMRLSLA